MKEREQEAGIQTCRKARILEDELKECLQVWKQENKWEICKNAYNLESKKKQASEVQELLLLRNQESNKAKSKKQAIEKQRSQQVAMQEHQQVKYKKLLIVRTQESNEENRPKQAIKS